MNSLQHFNTREISKYVRISAGDVFLLGDLQIPEEAATLVIFAYASGRCRNHPRTRHVARMMREKCLGTLLCDLMTEDEEAEDEVTGKMRENVTFLAKRLVEVTNWASSNQDTKQLRIGYFGACNGSAAALISAAKIPHKVAAVVSRDGRLDLAAKSLAHVSCPTLLIVGENDAEGIISNQQALVGLGGEKELQVVPGASYLFGEPGKLKVMAQMGADWLYDHLTESRTAADKRSETSLKWPRLH